jgi:hypothetical protein
MDANVDVDVEMEDLSLLPYISPSISKQDMMEICNCLSILIPPEGGRNDDRNLLSLWNMVIGVLSQDKNFKLASKAEYLKNVQDYPRDKFIDEVKEASRAKYKTSWGVIIKKSVYSILFCAPCSNDFIYLL